MDSLEPLIRPVNLMKPVVFLALPRTGTTMLVTAIASHPDAENIIHEWRGSEFDFWRHPYVLSNYWHPWMEDERITKIHVYREDQVAGARSMMMMGYTFPEGVVELPLDEVQACAENRRRMDAVFAQHADHTFTYESLCGGRDAWVLNGSSRLCGLLGLSPRGLKPSTRKEVKTRLKNESEVRELCLA